MTAGLEARRRRAVFRATHRGTKEMDWILGRFARSAVGNMGEVELSVFEDFLGVPDPEIQGWIMRPGPNVDLRFDAFIRRLRGFHGLCDGADEEPKNETSGR